MIGLTIVWGAGPYTLDCMKRGPQNFLAEDVTRGNDNLASSGYRERVVEATDVLVSWTMPSIYIGDDFAGWATFARWAQQGNSFRLNVGVGSAHAESYTCVLEDQGFKPVRAGIRRYSVAIKLRIVPDSDAPANAGEVMDSFWGQA